MSHYIQKVKKNGINTNPNIKFRITGRSSGIVDGDDGSGHVILHHAASEAIALARDNGIGAVSAINSSHCGALSYFAQMATNNGMIGIVVTNTDKMVVPFGGIEPFFGTNPIAFGFPSDKNPPILLDMATSSVAYGKVLEARQKKESIPDHWGVDAKGQATNDPDLLTALLPFGGAKGYGIGLVVDILAGILTGSPFGPHVKPMYGSEYGTRRKLGHFIIAINPVLFNESHNFGGYLDQLIDELHQAPAADANSRILLPGEMESIMEKKRRYEGIPLDSSVYDYLQSPSS